MASKEDTKIEPLLINSPNLPYSKQIEDLEEWVLSKECIDIYQLVAILHGINAGCDGDGGIINSYYKLWACFLLQTVGLIYVMLYYNNQTHECGEYDVSESEMQTVATLLALFIASISIDMALTISSTGLYGWYSWDSNPKNKNIPKFINRFWLGLGLLTNIFDVFCCAVTSIFAILSSQDIGDMLLNSIAIYFILELDDQMVSWGDLDTIKHFIEQYKQFNGDLDKINTNSGCVAKGCNKFCNSFNCIGDALLWSCHFIVESSVIRGILRLALPASFVYVSFCYQ